MVRLGAEPRTDPVFAEPVDGREHRRRFPPLCGTAFRLRRESAGAACPIANGTAPVPLLLPAQNSGRRLHSGGRCGILVQTL